MNYVGEVNRENVKEISSGYKSPEKLEKKLLDLIDEGDLNNARVRVYLSPYALYWVFVAIEEYVHQGVIEMVDQELKSNAEGEMP